MECLICGSASVKAIGKRSHFCDLQPFGRFVDSVEVFDRDIARCEACGFAFINPMYDSADFTRLYNPRTYDVFAEETGAKDSSPELIQAWLSQLAGLGISEWRETFERQRGKRPKMLDIGCGYGRVMNLFDNMGFEVSGIEINKAAVEHVRSASSYSVEEVGLSDYSTPDRYDLISLVHVIEHVPDPSAAIDKVLSLLSPDGLFFLETPWAEDIGRYDQRYRDIYHTLFFNHLSLFMLGIRHGLSVRRSQRTSFFTGPDYHKYIQVLYSPSSGAEIPASHVRSLGALFNGLEREHSDAINERQNQSSQLQATSNELQETTRQIEAIISSRKFRIATALAEPYVKLFSMASWKSRRR